MNLDFGYVDLNFCDKDGNFKLPHPERIHQSKVAERVKALSALNLFTTVQHYKDPIVAKGQLALAPFYLDLDSKDDLPKCLDEARAVCRYFTEYVEIPEPFVRVWFSGSKGFHITIEPEVFGAEPHPDIEDIVELAAKQVTQRLCLTTVDLGVYTHRRLWRLPNSKHLKTGLHCVELRHMELTTIEAVKALAGAPREALLPPEETICTAPVNPKWWLVFVEAKRSKDTLSLLNPTKPPHLPEGVDKGDLPTAIPPCIQDLLKGGLKRDGTRHDAVLTMATWFKDFGWTTEQAMAVLVDWSRRVVNGQYSDSTLEEAAADARATTLSVYANDRHASCHFTRCLGVTRSGAGSVECLEDKCPFVTEQDQAPKAPLTLSLDQAFKAINMGQEEQFEARVVDASDTPYILPAEGVIECVPNLDDGRSVCNRCPCSENTKNGKAVSPFIISPARHPGLLLGMCGEDDKNKNEIIRIHVKIPKGCPRHHVKPLKMVNILEVTVVPNIDIRVAGQHKAVNNVAACIYLVGHTLEPNKTYLFRGNLTSHPKTQSATFLVHEFKSTKSAVDDFALTQEQIDRLRIFNPAQGQTTAEKMDDIWDELEKTVTYIWNRRAMMIGLDLTYHSALYYHMQGQKERGWINFLIVGDTDQAKTTGVERLMEHYDLGQMIVCEGASLPGLTSATQMIAGKWVVQYGVFAINDRGFVGMDEFGQLKPEDVERMGTVRDKGVISSLKAVHGQALGRCRGIYIANCKGKMGINKYQYGATALVDLFNKDKDLRRYDMGMTLAKGEVGASVINQYLAAATKEPRYSSLDCRLLLLWAWSRTPEQIILTDPVVHAILKAATRMSTRYTHDDIPLCQEGSMRKKIARLAIAAAMRTFSTPDGVRCHVTLDHVKFVEDYLNAVYNQPSMAFGDFCELWKKHNEISKELYAELGFRFSQRPGLLEWLRDNQFFTKQDICDANGIDADKAKEITTYLARNFLIERKSTAYVKTPAFIKTINSMLKEGLLPDPLQHPAQVPDHVGEERATLAG